MTIHDRKILAWKIVLCAALVVQVCAWFFQPLIPGLAEYWWHGAENEFVSGWKSYDREIIKASGGPDGGNISLMLLRLNPAENSHRLFAQSVLCRGSYALYPRRVWAADEGTVLNGGEDAIQMRFNPSIEWLRAHDVRGVMEGLPAPNNQVVSEIHAVGERR